MFDDDASVDAFLAHALERFHAHPDAQTPFAAERYMKYPSMRLDDVPDAGAAAPIPERHAAGTRCPARPGFPKGTLVARLCGRALDAEGKSVGDAVSQERYVEDRFEISTEGQAMLAQAVADAPDGRAAVPDVLARLLVAHAFLGQLDVRPVGSPFDAHDEALRRCELRVERIDASRLRLTGRSEVAGGIESRPGDGASFRHAVTLDWEGLVDLEGNRITRLLVTASGTEKLRWGSPGPDALCDVANLPGGRPIDFEGRVRYGIEGAPVTEEETASGQSAPGVPGDPPPPSLHAKMEKLHAGVERWQSQGRDPGPIGEIMQSFEPLMHAGKFHEAEGVLDRALAFLNGDATGPDPAQEVHERFVKLQQAIRKLLAEGKTREAEQVLDAAVKEAEAR